MGWRDDTARWSFAILFLRTFLVFGCRALVLSSTHTCSLLPRCYWSRVLNFILDLFDILSSHLRNCTRLSLCWPLARMFCRWYDWAEIVELRICDLRIRQPWSWSHNCACCTTLNFFNLEQMVFKSSRLRPILQEHLQVIETDDYDCQVVHWTLYSSLLYDRVCHRSTHLVHSFWIQRSLLSFSRLDGINCVPASIKYLLVAESIKDSITAEYDKVMEIVSHGELRYLRLRNNDSFFASILGMLGLDITEGTRHRKPARYHSMGSQ